MTTIPIGRPRRIDPSLIEIGDDVSAEAKKDRGLTITTRGIVDKIIPMGNQRHFYTAEGAIIFSWRPGGKSTHKLILYGREEIPTETLFDAMDDVRKRVA